MSRIQPNNVSRRKKTKHHLLFPGADWNSGAARNLRSRFSRKILNDTHVELHRRITCVPVPPYPMLEKAWTKYKKEEAAVNNLDALESIQWLMRNIPDRNFKRAMQKQYDFLRTHEH